MRTSAPRPRSSSSIVDFALRAFRCVLLIRKAQDFLLSWEPPAGSDVAKSLKRWTPKKQYRKHESLNLFRICTYKIPLPISFRFRTYTSLSKQTTYNPCSFLQLQTSFPLTPFALRTYAISRFLLVGGILPLVHPERSPRRTTSSFTAPSTHHQSELSLL